MADRGFEIFDAAGNSMASSRDFVWNIAGNFKVPKAMDAENALEIEDVYDPGAEDAETEDGEEIVDPVESGVEGYALEGPYVPGPVSVGPVVGGTSGDWNPRERYYYSLDPVLRNSRVEVVIHNTDQTRGKIPASYTLEVFDDVLTVVVTPGQVEATGTIFVQ